MISNVMRFVYYPEGTDPANQTSPHRKQPKRIDLIDNFTYLRDHSEQLQQVRAKFESTETSERLLQIVEGFIPKDKLPTHLELFFLAQAPELKHWEGQWFLDASLAVAGGHEQISHILASDLYRVTMRPDGPAPGEAVGREAFIASFRWLAHEAIAAWLEQYLELSFDSDHPRLGTPLPIRKEAVSRFPGVFHNIEKYLRVVLDEPDYMKEKGDAIDSLLRGVSSYSAMGHAMTSLIVARFGEERLRECAGSTTTFLRTYQEAARMRYNPQTAEIEGDHLPGLAKLPAFEDGIFEKLMAVLAEES
jgi:hypothetical protein